MSGYSFLFSPVQPAALRPLRPLPTFILNYDFADMLAKSVAERIAVNVRQAGISMQPVGENIGGRGANGEAWLARMRVDSTDESTALLHLAAQMSADKSKIGSPSTPEQLFRAESALLEDASIIPLAHLPETYGLSPRVRSRAAPIAGGWPLADVRLETLAGAVRLSRGVVRASVGGDGRGRARSIPPGPRFSGGACAGNHRRAADTTGTTCLLYSRRSAVG